MLLFLPKIGGTILDGIEITVNDTLIKSNEKVDLLGLLTSDDKLSFETHVSAICKKASGQLNALTL